MRTLGRYRWWLIIFAILLVGLWWRSQSSRTGSEAARDGGGLISGHDPLDLKRGSIPGNRDGTPGQDQGK